MMAAKVKQAIFCLLTTHHHSGLQAYIQTFLNVSDVIFSEKSVPEKNTQGREQSFSCFSHY